MKVISASRFKRAQQNVRFERVIERFAEMRGREAQAQFSEEDIAGMREATYALIRQYSLEKRAAGRPYNLSPGP